MTTALVLDALNQAISQRLSSKTQGLIHHSDRGAQYLSLKYTERLAQAGMDTSVGSVGDSYDNALAESVIRLFKAEVINLLGPWKSMAQVEWQTLTCRCTGSTPSACTAPLDTSHPTTPRTNSMQA